MCVRIELLQVPLNCPHYIDKHAHTVRDKVLLQLRFCKMATPTHIRLVPLSLIPRKCPPYGGDLPPFIATTAEHSHMPLFISGFGFFTRQSCLALPKHSIITSCISRKAVAAGKAGKSEKMRGVGMWKCSTELNSSHSSIYLCLIFYLLALLCLTSTQLLLRSLRFTLSIRPVWRMLKLALQKYS